MDAQPDSITAATPPKIIGVPDAKVILEALTTIADGVAAINERLDRLEQKFAALPATPPLSFDFASLREQLAKLIAPKPVQSHQQVEPTWREWRPEDGTLH